jgi:hypothetical protein
LQRHCTDQLGLAKHYGDDAVWEGFVSFHFLSKSFYSHNLVTLPTILLGLKQSS